jgi:hypothetical protein
MKCIAEDLMASFLHWKWRMSWVHFDGTQPIGYPALVLSYGGGMVKL